MKIATTLLALHIVFLFSMVSPNTTTADYAAVGSPPTIRNYGIVQPVVSKPKIERMPFSGCSDVYNYMLPRLGHNKALIMKSIAFSESGCRQFAKNPTSSASGVFQIMYNTARGYNCGDRFNAWENMDCAIRIYKAAGFSQWEVCNKGVVRCW